MVCATICSCDDYDDIVDWGEARLDFLRRYLEFHWGIPCVDWLRTLMNRVDPELFSACFMAWVAECWPERPDLLALDGKTSRRSHDRKTGQAPLHLVSAFATNARLVLGQEAVADKSCELEAIPALLGRLVEAGRLKVRLVTIDAVACNPKIAGQIVAHGGDYLLAVKANQPGLRAEVERFFFADALLEALDADLDVDKGHGRIEDRRVFVSRDVDWLVGQRRFPGEYRFPNIAAVAKIETWTELRTVAANETRYFICSRAICAKHLAQPSAATAHRPPCTGCSTSPSARTSHACARATGPRTWPSSDTALNLVHRPNDKRSTAAPQARRLEPQLPHRDPTGEPSRDPGPVGLLTTRRRCLKAPCSGVMALQL